MINAFENISTDGNPKLFHPSRTGGKMTKIKQMLKGAAEHYKPVIARYPETLILIALTSLTAAVCIDQSGKIGKFMEDKGILFFFLWGIGTYFIETYRPKGKMIKAVCFGAAGMAALAAVFFLNTGTELRQEIAGHWTAAYVIILISLGIYRNFRDSGLLFNRYCIRTIHELSRTAIACFITGVGLALVVSVFVVLILNGSHFMLIIRSEFLVLGCITGSGILYALITSDRELPRFFVTIVRSLLLTMLLIAFAIVYVYILKIIITRVVPSNEIFRILAGLFIIGLPIWTIAGTFDENSFPVRIGVRLPYIFIPFLFLQGYAIRERIAAYGMTPMRYLCLALMLFECIYIAVYHLRRRETGVMIPVFAVMSVIALAVPYVNMYSTANRSQKAIFDRSAGTAFADLSPKDQSSLAGAYYYLARNPQGKILLADSDPERIQTIRDSGMIGSPDYDHNIYILYEFPMTDIDISGFNRMTSVSSTPVHDDKTPDYIDPENVSFYDNADNTVISADIRGFINDCIASNEVNSLSTPDFPGVIKIDESRLIRVRDCAMTIEPDMRISFLSINGILLTAQ